MHRISNWPRRFQSNDYSFARFSSVVIVEGLKAEQPNDRHGHRISILSGFSCSLASFARSYC